MDPVYLVETEKSVERAGADLEAACKRHKFGVLAVHDLREKMKEKGVDFRKDCLIYEVCNPHKAKAVLEEDLRISTALPCRITIYRDGERTILATIRPRLMLDMFGAKDLAPIAAEVEETLTTIMKEAGGGHE